MTFRAEVTVSPTRWHVLLFQFCLEDLSCVCHCVFGSRFILAQQNSSFKEADQNSQIICRDDLQEAQMACIDLAQLDRVQKKASSKIKRLGRSVSQRRTPRETEKPPLTMFEEKPTGGTSTSKKGQDGYGTMKSNPDDELKKCFSSRWSLSDECYFVFSIVFSTEFLVVRRNKYHPGCSAGKLERRSSER